MGYVYVFTNSEHPNMSKIGYADDWEKRLSEAKREPNNTAVIEAYGVYKVDERLGDKKLHAMINDLNPNLKYTKEDGTKTEFFSITPKEAYNLLKAIAEISGTTDRLTLIAESEEKSDVAKEKQNKSTLAEEDVTETSISEPNRKSKKSVVQFLNQKGYFPLGKNITLAKHTGTIYWTTPKPYTFESNWTLILDDIKNKKYYIFEIGKDKIDLNRLVWWSDHLKYNIKIVYGDENFTDKMSKISFINYYKAEIDYSDEPINIAHKESAESSKTTENKELTKTALSEIPNNFCNHPIAYFEFQNEHHNASAWKDALDVVVNYLYKKHPSDIYSLAQLNIRLDLKSKNSKNPFFSLGTDAFSDEDRAHHIEDTNIYFKTNYSVTTIINRCIKGLLNLFNEDLDQLVFWYY